MEWLKRRVRDVAGVHGPTRVCLAGRIVDGPRVVSPFTGISASVFVWSLSVNTRPTLAAGISGIVEGLTERGGTGALNQEPKLSPVEELVWAEELRIGARDAVVAIPLQGLEVRLRSVGSEPAPVDIAWPETLPLPRRDRDGALYFVERTLLAGDPVELRATIEPLAGGGAYRGGGSAATFLARADLERVLLVELPGEGGRR